MNSCYNHSNIKNDALNVKVIYLKKKETRWDVIDFDSIRPAFTATGGLVLSQVVEITGVGSSTIQNWIKRGWIPSPVDKKYGERQVARILIVDMLRKSMQLEKIVRLMECVNGNVEDQSDDIIKDADLYTYIYRIIQKIKPVEKFTLDRIDEIISEEINDYNGPGENYTGNVSNTAQRLHEALRIIIMTYISSELRKRAEYELDQM